MAPKIGKPYQRSSDGMWCVAINLATSGPRDRRVVVRKDKGEAVAEAQDRLDKYRESGYIATPSQTVEQWINFWLLEVVAKEVRPKTAGNYRTFAKHIVRIIGKVRLDKLGPKDITKVGDVLTRELSPTSAATAHRIMSSCFAAAVRAERIKRNPVKLARAPRIPATNLEVLTVEEAVRLVAMFGDSPERYIWATFLLTGARRGEILGLTWDRVTDVLDLSWQLQRHSVEMVAPIDYEYQRLEGGLYLTRPKTKKAWRIVPLVQPLSGVLARWREQAPPNAHNLVFTTADGGPIDPNILSKKWPAILAATGITKRVRIHDLRHVAVDLMYAQGLHETMIQDIVGHSTRSMTRAYKSTGNVTQLTDGMRKFSELFEPNSSAIDS